MSSRAISLDFCVCLSISLTCVEIPSLSCRGPHILELCVCFLGLFFLLQFWAYMITRMLKTLSEIGNSQGECSRRKGKLCCFFKTKIYFFRVFLEQEIWEKGTKSSHVLPGPHTHIQSHPTHIDPHRKHTKIETQKERGREYRDSDRETKKKHTANDFCVVPWVRVA